MDSSSTANNKIAQPGHGCQSPSKATIRRRRGRLRSKEAQRLTWSSSHRPTPRPDVTLYPELSVAALNAKKDKELCLWYELRSLNSSGSGRLDLDDVFDALVPAFYSKSTLIRILEAGDKVFWDLPKYGRSYLMLRGLESVSRYLDTTQISRPVIVPDGKWPRSRKGKRAWLYASFHGSNGKANPKPISRQSIQEATSISRRQQIRYEKVVKVRRTPNFVVRQVGDRLLPVKHEVYGKNRSYWKHRRLGNSYKTPAMAAHWGMVKKVNRALMARSWNGDEARWPRRFFLTASSFVRCPERDPQCFISALPGERHIRGRHEWVAV
ncbi:hypothetical protein ES703_111034 [subsurface metagenome]